MKEENKYKTAIFAGGCFWCTEAIFNQLKGVVSVESGYIGGQVEHPTYEQVCTGTTGHAEAIKIEFDPSEISYSALLEVFFVTHDPTTLNRQGNDIGTQYRSEIFYLDAEQQKVATEYLNILKRERVFEQPIVTALSPAEQFYVAENYHKDYFSINPAQPYCQAVVKPKVEAFKHGFASKLKKE